MPDKIFLKKSVDPALVEQARAVVKANFRRVRLERGFADFAKTGNRMRKETPGDVLSSANYRLRQWWMLANKPNSAHIAQALNDNGLKITSSAIRLYWSETTPTPLDPSNPVHVAVVEYVRQAAGKADADYIWNGPTVLLTPAKAKKATVNAEVQELLVTLVTTIRDPERTEEVKDHASELLMQLLGVDHDEAVKRVAETRAKLETKANDP